MQAHVGSKRSQLPIEGEKQAVGRTVGQLELEYLGIRVQRAEEYAREVRRVVKGRTCLSCCFVVEPKAQVC